MSFQPCGSEPWPTSVHISRCDGQTSRFIITSLVTLERSVFTLVWYYSPQILDSFHNIAAPSGGYVSPAYICPDCNKIILIPFPEVETLKELWHFFEKHVEAHV